MLRKHDSFCLTTKKANQNCVGHMTATAMHPETVPKLANVLRGKKALQDITDAVTFSRWKMVKKRVLIDS